jgi:acetylornithine deacetylase
VHELDRAIDQLAPRAFDLLGQLVAEPSTIGQEQGAEEVLASELSAAGFEITRLAIPESIRNDAAAGIPIRSYAGRYDLIGERGDTDGAPSLIINGHIDVVPADEASLWTTPPFQPTIVDGWMVGRGAGDMKGGFAAGLLALWALDEVSPEWQRGKLTVVAAIEEESTGNGTLAAGRAGFLADAALLLEPTDLELLLGGISLIWVGIEIEGLAGHAEAAQQSVNPILGAIPIIDALSRLESQMNAAHAAGDNSDQAFGAIAHPYNVNVGKLHAGDWASSVPAIARLEVRVGHPGSWSSDEAFERVNAAINEAVARDEWLSEHPPTVKLTGYRAQRYLQDAGGNIVTAIADAHSLAHGNLPNTVAIGSTTDARFYLNQFGVPAVAYGPRTRNMHGTDEAVELQSIVDVARTVARFLSSWYREGASS